MKSLFIVSMVLGILFVSGVNGMTFEELAWEDISKGIVEVNAVWVDGQNPSKIFLGTNRGVFKTEDGGNSWQAILSGASKKVNFLYVDKADKNLIYAACIRGLFFSRNQGKTWQRIYTGKSKEENNCLGILKLTENKLYLATQAGLFQSQDNGQTWNKFTGRLGNLPIWAIAAEKINRLIYLAASDGVYKIDQQAVVSRIFISRSTDSEDVEIDPMDSWINEFSGEFGYQINYICVDPNEPQEIYLATTQGIFKTKDEGRAWERFSDFGLLGKDVRSIVILPDSTVLVATNSGVFIYNKDRWQEVSSRLTLQDIRFLGTDQYGNIYAAGDKGLFRSGTDFRKIIYASARVTNEPTILQVQQAAIEYAQIIAPQWIAAHRKLARLKAVLPDFRLDYTKTISSYNNSKVSRFTVGPRDWGVSFTWNLSDLIWSEQQRLIDSQTRLMVKLRQDILDEVTRLYFARRKLQLEYIYCSDPKKKQVKKLRIEEFTALLDGLTGGYFSIAKAHTLGKAAKELALR